MKNFRIIIAVSFFLVSIFGRDFVIVQSIDEALEFAAAETENNPYFLSFHKHGEVICSDCHLHHHQNSSDDNGHQHSHSHQFSLSFDLAIPVAARIRNQSVGNENCFWASTSLVIKSSQLKRELRPPILLG
jgi:hypothetical protein